MHILIAPDSFKGSLSSARAAAIMTKSCREVFPRARITQFPLADGGEGTLDVLHTILGGSYAAARASNPLGRTISARWLKKGRTAFIEMAAASGLTLIAEERRNPLETTTYGTGQLVAAALESGCRTIYIGIGGSATTDGGIGALTALGVRFYSAAGCLIRPGAGRDLETIARIDTSGLRPEAKRCRFIVLSDVKNPLHGRQGAAYVYGPQKGADAGMVRRLDKGLRNYARIAEKQLGRSVAGIPGSGAAGGLGAALIGFLNAETRSGIEEILKLGGFENHLKRADLFLTGEGKLDGQIRYGKALGPLFRLAEKYRVPTIALAGAVDPEVYRVVTAPNISLVSIVPGPCTLTEAMASAPRFLAWKTTQVLKLV